MQLKSLGSNSKRSFGRRFLGTWSVAILCGSVIAACSGTIDTPSEEFPQRQADDDSGESANVRPGTGNNNSNSSSDDDDQQAAANDEDEDEDLPAADEEDEQQVEDEDLPAEDPDQDEDPPATTTELSFEADVWPIFNDSCGPCHVSAGLGQQNIGSDDLEEALADAVSFEDAVIAEIEGGTMPPSGCGGPPGSDGCISEEDFQTIQDWYDAGAPE